MAAPPTLNRQLGMSMERSLPKYQFWVMFSMLSTRQFWLGYTCTPLYQALLLIMLDTTSDQLNLPGAV